MLWWPLFFIAIVLADEMSAEQYCFKSPQESLRTSQNLRAITIPSDVLTPQAECFTVKMLPHRRELIQSYVRRISSDVQISFSSSEVTHPPCQLKVEKIRSGHSQEMNAQVNSYPGAELTSTKQSEKDEMSIQTLKNFELNISQQVIKGECRYINADRYEITLEVRKDPLPLPQVPPGTILIQNAPQPDQKTSMLQTTLQLQRGSRIEIGGIVREMKNKDQQIDVSPAGEIKTNEAQFSEQVFLTLQ